MTRHLRPMIAAAFVAISVVAFVAGWPLAQPQLQPRVIQIDTMTCGELLGLKSDIQDRFLLFLDGYVSGARKDRVWNEVVHGAIVERALATCRADPRVSALGAFMRAAGL
jgi:HdeA/HdeB family